MFSNFRTAIIKQTWFSKGPASSDLKIVIDFNTSFNRAKDLEETILHQRVCGLVGLLLDIMAQNHASFVNR